MHFSEGIFLQRTSGTWRREDKVEKVRSKNLRNKDLRWCKSPWEWSYNALWALAGKSREALDGTSYQSPERMTLINKNYLN